METIAFVIGTSGLIAVVEKTFALFQLIDDIREFAQDTEEILFQVENEIAKAQCWALEVAQHATDTDTEPPATGPEEVVELVKSIARNGFDRLNQAIDEAKGIIQKHQLSPPAGKTVELEDKSIATALLPGLAVLSMGTAKAELKEKLGQQQRLSWLKRLPNRKKAAFVAKPWGVDDKTNLTNIAGRLAYWNSELWSLLSRHKQDYLIYQVSCQIMSRAEGDKVLEAIKQISPKGSDLEASAGLSLHRLHLNDDDHIQCAQKPLSIQWSDIGFASAGRRGGPPHPFADYSLASLRTGSKDVLLIDWVRYGHLEAADQQLVKSRVVGISALLSETNKPSRLQTLPSTGYTQDVAEKRFGIVLRLPQQPDGHDKAVFTVYTLEKIMTMGSTTKDVANRRPTLEQRFRLARTLAYTFMELHKARWLHKGFNSQKIVFFSTKSDETGGTQSALPRIDFDNAYIVGFGFARPSHPGETSLPVLWKPSTHIYTHPDLRLDEESTSSDIEEESVTKSETRYLPAHDLYSLAIVLLEIGLWQPLLPIVMRGGDLSPQGLKEQFRKLAERNLAHTTGEKYRDAVVAALDWTMTPQTGITDEQRWSSGLERTYWNIVKPLEECACGLS